LYEGKGKLVLRHGGLIQFEFDRPHEVRWVQISLAGPHAQWERRLWIAFLEPRKRKNNISYTLSPDGCRWYTVERDGVVEYDTRGVFPAYHSLEEYRAVRDQRHGYGPGPENDAAVARRDAELAQLTARFPNWNRFPAYVE
jgi:hypothetical protein